MSGWAGLWIGIGLFCVGLGIEGAGRLIAAALHRFGMGGKP